MLTKAEITLLLADVGEKLDDLDGNFDLIAWGDFVSDRGTPCCRWVPAEPMEHVYLAAVRLLMPKHGSLHARFAEQFRVANNMTYHPAYSVLTKGLSRLFYPARPRELRSMYSLARSVSHEMRDRGLTEIRSLADVGITSYPIKKLPAGYGL